MKALDNAVLMCHAPIVIPKIAGPRGAQVQQSTEAMAKAAKHVLSKRPEVLVLISPHAPRLRSTFGIIQGFADTLYGNFGNFGAADLEIELPYAKDAAKVLLTTTAQSAFEIAAIPPNPLDHGSMVPLYFLQEAGWKGATLILSFPYAPTLKQCQELGALIADAAAASGKRWALVASGDMSHRLVPHAPAGYHPRAQEFDEAFTKRINQGLLLDAMAIDPELRELAAEDVVDSVAVATGATGGLAHGLKVLSYEGPFGVGYLVAILQDGLPAPAARSSHDNSRQLA